MIKIIVLLLNGSGVTNVYNKIKIDENHYLEKI